jgi:CRP/FNR family transcriptional regulator, cyclic AMP receptor protein
VRLGKNKKVELIRQVPLFSRCSRKELEAIASIADQIDLPEGKEIIREGERGREFFVLVEGSVDVRKGTRKLRTLKAGDFVGEVALVADIPRTASVTTAEPVHALVITESSFRRLLETSMQIQVKILEALAWRLAETRQASAL